MRSWNAASAIGRSPSIWFKRIESEAHIGERFTDQIHDALPLDGRIADEMHHRRELPADALVHVL